MRVSSIGRSSSALVAFFVDRRPPFLRRFANVRYFFYRITIPVNVVLSCTVIADWAILYYRCPVVLVLLPVVQDRMRCKLEPTVPRIQYVSPKIFRIIHTVAYGYDSILQITPIKIQIYLLLEAVPLWRGTLVMCIQC